MAISAPKTLTLRLSDVRPLGAGIEFKPELFKMNTVIYGNLRKEKSDKN